MADPIVIDPEEPLDPGLDYPLLLEEGLELVQQLSSDIWTDYNESDPGVTALEQLCYALTELSYRAEIPLEDLLAQRSTGRIDTRRQALFEARRILPCNPVTENDYRRLLIDRVPRLANVWLTRHRVDRPWQQVDGLYDIWLYAPGLHDPACHPDEEPDLRRRVRRVYYRHRGLTEDLHRLHILQPLSVRVLGDLTIETEAEPETVLAQALFQLGNFLAPEPRRHPLEVSIARGEGPSQIFDGPLMLHGFIDEDELQPKAQAVRVAELARVLASVDGVRGVLDVRARVGRDTYQRQEAFQVPWKKIPRLHTTKRRGGYTLRLLRDGIVIEPDAKRVERQLARLWARQRRSFPLRAQYDEYFGLPEGQWRDVRAYSSVQDQFPAVYGIGYDGLPSEATSARRGQAKQLQGYLLVFDQLMADFFAQLARAKDLYSTDRELYRTYFFQYLDRSVPNVAPLLRTRDQGPPDYHTGLPRLVASQDPAVARRNRFLDLLLALYAESLEPSSILPDNLVRRGPGGDEGTAWRLRRARLDFLHQLVESTADRGRGFDLMVEPSARNVAGLEIKTRIQLEMHESSLDEKLDALALQLVEPGSQTSFGRPLHHHLEQVEDDFEALAETNTIVATESRPTASTGAAMASVAMTEDLLAIASRPDAYRLGTLPGDDQVTVACRDGQGGWLLVGSFPSRAEAEIWTWDCVRRMDEACRHQQQLYVVEHNLLRYGRSRRCRHRHDPCCYRRGRHYCHRHCHHHCHHHRCHHHRCHHHHCHHHPHDRFVYDFTITVVIGVGHRLRHSSDYRRFVDEVLRANTPAHIRVETLYLGPWHLCRFERLDRKWRKALRRWSRRRRLRDLRKLVHASADLRCFLEHRRHHDATDSERVSFGQPGSGWASIGGTS